MERREIREQIEQTLGAGENIVTPNAVAAIEIDGRRGRELQVRHVDLQKLTAEPELTTFTATTHEVDPKLLKPHPVSARLYLPLEDWNLDDRQPITPDEAGNLVIQQMETDDLKNSIDRNGILVPLIINNDGIIVSGSRRWKVAMELGLTRVPVEVRTFNDELDERQAIID